jgi:hypothetical protein
VLVEGGEERWRGPRHKQLLSCLLRWVWGAGDTCK